MPMIFPNEIRKPPLRFLIVTAGKALRLVSDPKKYKASFCGLHLPVIVYVWRTFFPSDDLT